MESQNVLPRYGEAFLRLFYPSFCATCGQLLELEEKGLCLGCRSRLQKLRLLPSEERIRLHGSYGEEGWTLFRYEDPLKEILHQVKFGKRRDLLQLFNPDLALFLARRRQLSSYDCLIPIPLDPRRRLEREFNQSGLLANQIHKILRTPLERRGLVKKRSTAPQSLLGREARKLNLHRVFHTPHPRRIRGKSVLLIDDIFTTGSTLEEAAKTLKARGACRVGYLALARALAPATTHGGSATPCGGN